MYMRGIALILYIIRLILISFFNW